MVTSDPLAEGGDPGFRNKIFVAVSADTAGRMSMDAGYTILSRISRGPGA